MSRSHQYRPVFRWYSRRWRSKKEDKRFLNHYERARARELLNRGTEDDYSLLKTNQYPRPDDNGVREGYYWATEDQWGYTRTTVYRDRVQERLTGKYCVRVREEYVPPDEHYKQAMRK